MLLIYPSIPRSQYIISVNAKQRVWERVAHRDGFVKRREEREK